MVHGAINPTWSKIFVFASPRVFEIFDPRKYFPDPVLVRGYLPIYQYENPIQNISMPPAVRVVQNQQKMKPFQYLILCLFTSKSSLAIFWTSIFDSNWLKKCYLEYRTLQSQARTHLLQQLDENDAAFKAVNDGIFLVVLR